MTINEIFEELSKCDFSNLDEYNCEENVVDRLNEDDIEWWTSGATKVVILFKGCDFVIKIPFSGYEVGQPACDYCNHCGDYCDNCDGDQYYEFMEFMNAGWVFEDSDNEWDYCATEEQIYHNIADYSHELGIALNKAFAATEFVGMVDHYPIYTQPLCRTFFSVPESIHSPRTKENELFITNAQSQNPSELTNTTWLNDVLTTYGQEFLTELLVMINEMHLTDFHNSNIGYTKDGAPVIIDYCGFYED